MQEDDTSFQEFTDPSGEVPRLDEHRYTLPPEICRSDRESRAKETFVKRSKIIKEIRNFLDGEDLWK